MTIDEKRQKLTEYCNKQDACHECPLCRGGFGCTYDAYRDQIEIIPVNTLIEVLEYALVGPKKDEFIKELKQNKAILNNVIFK